MRLAAAVRQWKTPLWGEQDMSSRWGCRAGVAAGICLGILLGISLSVSGVPALAQEDPLKPIPAGECQQIASQLQTATGIPMKAGEDDFSDINTGEDGRSCHITGSASDKTFANPDELMDKMTQVLAGWSDDPERADSGPDGADKGLTKGNRLVVLGVSWEPGPGLNCSDKAPLSACKILPQQRLWTATADIVEKAGK
jgi:hypothetical protein